MTEKTLFRLAAYAVLYALYFILSVYWAAGGTVTTLTIGVGRNCQRRNASSKSQKSI